LLRSYLSRSGSDDAIQPRTPAGSFNHHVGAGEQRWRDINPESFGGLEIYRQFKPRRPLDRQIGRSLAFQKRLRL
jgi:hypothetical protein